MNLTFTDNAWCYLYSVPDLNGGGKPLKPGAADTYGRSDPDSGAYYVALTEGRGSRGNYKVQRDLELSLVYAERVFVYGTDDEGASLPWVTLMAALKEIKLNGDPGFWNEVKVYRGWAKGKTVYYDALRAHTDIGARWHTVREALAKLTEPSYQVTPSRGRPFADVYFFGKETAASSDTPP